MNFSYLEPLTEFAFRSVAAPAVQPTPTELDDSWKAFEVQLGSFKTQYAKSRANVTVLQSRIASKQADLNVLEMASKVLKSDGLKASVSDIVSEYQITEELPALTQEYANALGKLEAQKKVMMDTNAERYARFTCFVCMDALVDTFLDPCSHVVCERCWLRTRSSTCPGCRAEVHNAKKIYTLS
jgi:hypothetical protein